ncbi:MAG: hypothetical protein CM1200mP38_2500 [Dehalococcoidia bacterium]|nr:MAG: hypothetical protein CM1200mP38_2500 [Dehalococcoidia bacterium]
MAVREKLNVPLVVRAPSGGGIRGALYHSQSVEQFFSHTPGLKVNFAVHSI